MSAKSGRRTLFWSVIMSAPGPIVVGIGLLIGKSSTQLADFIRRSIELLAIILSFVVFSVTGKDGAADQNKKDRLEKTADIFVSVAMILSGTIMLVWLLLQKIPKRET